MGDRRDEPEDDAVEIVLPAAPPGSTPGPRSASSPRASSSSSADSSRRRTTRFLGRVTLAPSPDAAAGTEPLVAPCVYKPIRGERPLWDFPDGTLAARELAAYVLSEATPWAIVPPTVMRPGRFGEGMVQLWLEPDPSVDRVSLVVDADERLRAMAIFDIVVNNADRKVGHLLPMADGHVFGVDHGICFHEEPHLRTVLWAWQGERIRPDELEVLGSPPGRPRWRARTVAQAVADAITTECISSASRSGRPRSRPHTSTTICRETIANRARPRGRAAQAASALINWSSIRRACSCAASAAMSTNPSSEPPRRFACTASSISASSRNVAFEPS